MGLHPCDVDRLIAIVQRPPRRGEHGGRRRARPGGDAPPTCWSTSAPGRVRGVGNLLYAGPPEGVAEVSGSVTGEFLSGRRRVDRPRARAAAVKGGHLS